MLHVWNNIDHAEDIEHVAIPNDQISKWSQPQLPTALIATESHVATRCETDFETCVFDFGNGLYTFDSSETEEGSGPVPLSNREHRALEHEGALFMKPFGRVINYRQGSGSEVLGTLEVPICCSFHPDQWVFDHSTGFFLAGGFRSRLLFALLIREDSIPHRSEPGPLKLSLVSAGPTLHARVSLVGKQRSQYTAFISHAGPDKQDIALPDTVDLWKWGSIHLWTRRNYGQEM